MKDTFYGRNQEITNLTFNTNDKKDRFCLTIKEINEMRLPILENILYYLYHFFILL